jgi:hypothetical protein
MTRLQDLDPQAVADETVGLVLAHIHSLAFMIGHTEPIPATGTSSLGYETVELTRYAQQGPPHCNDGGGPSGYMQTITGALYSAAEPSVYSQAKTVFDRREGECETAIETVLLAAAARDAIAQRQRVPIKWLAALAGLGTQYLKNLISRGELEGASGEVKAGAAKRWLSGRGVPGYS